MMPSLLQWTSPAAGPSSRTRSLAPPAAQLALLVCTSTSATTLLRQLMSRLGRRWPPVSQGAPGEFLTGEGQTSPGLRWPPMVGKLGVPMEAISSPVLTRTRSSLPSRPSNGDYLGLLASTAPDPCRLPTPPTLMPRQTYVRADAARRTGQRESFSRGRVRHLQA